MRVSTTRGSSALRRIIVIGPLDVRINLFKLRNLLFGEIWL